MGISTIVTAALPIPATLLHIIPVFASHERMLAVYSSLFCFLALAYVFYIRHVLARSMFRGRLGYTIVPLLLIAFAVLCLCFYHSGLDAAVAVARERITQESAEKLSGSGLPAFTPDRAYVLASLPSEEITNGVKLLFLYIGFFTFTELSFVVMAVREYMQDVLKLDESALYGGQYSVRSSSSRNPPLRDTREGAIRTKGSAIGSGNAASPNPGPQADV
jgi:hypothetical protein